MHHTLQALNPVNVTPAARSREVAQTTTGALKLIDCVRVNSSRAEGYTIKIYHNTSSATSSRIPVQSYQQGQQAALLSTVLLPKPDTRIERSYADFLGLQLELQHCVHVAHRVIPCAFCSEVSSVTTWGGVRASPLAMLAMTEGELLDTFTTFINELLVLHRTKFPATRRCLCSAHESAVQIFHEFLELSRT